MYSQKKYTDKLGSCSATIKSSGCYITSLCNLNEILNFMGKINPSEMNKLCIRYGFYSNGCMLNSIALTKFLKLNYEKSMQKPKNLCIAETDHYKNLGVPQHFFLYNSKTNEKVDPLDMDPAWRTNNYHIVSYRIYAPQSVPKPEVAPTPQIATETPVAPPTNATTPLPINAIGGDTGIMEKQAYEQKQASQAVEDLATLILTMLKSIWTKFSLFFKTKK